MKPGQVLCCCGEAYWPKQLWMHEGHVLSVVDSNVAEEVSTTVAVANRVVDTARERGGAVVDARARDRHRKTAKRREYLRLKQRESRARRRAAGRVSA